MKRNRNISVITNPPIEKILNPIRKFLHAQAASGIILVTVTIISLILANTSYSHIYFGLWNIKIAIGFKDFIISQPLLFWINEGLMTFFFFVVGLEIKRELLIGELSSFKKASLPVFAAFGGMLFPALIFLAFNFRGEGQNGWGIPVATDIAFSLGILSLLKNKIPFSLKVFLTALAIIDDLGAVIVIAVFYSYSVYVSILSFGLIIIVLLFLLNLLHVRNPILYIIMGILLWAVFLKAGIHPTIAGVILAFMIPAKARINSKSFIESNKYSLSELEKSVSLGIDVPVTSEFSSNIFEIEENCEKVLSPSQRIEHKLNPYVAYFIVPVFAFANAGVAIRTDFFSSLIQPITLGIIIGLVFGKQIGIFLFTWITNKLRITDLPVSASWKQIYGVAALGGIGFTMSLFISSLAFSDSFSIEQAKIGILSGSLISAIFGWLVLRFNLK